jgi:site-specific DNA-cytosine methylase
MGNGCAYFFQNNIKIEIVGAYDIKKACAQIAKAMMGIHPSGALPPAFKFGPKVGDVLSLDVRTLPDADVIIAGPKCTPWSKTGSKQGENAADADILKKIIECVCELANRGTLQLYVIEEVVEIGHAMNNLEPMLPKVVASSMEGFSIIVALCKWAHNILCMCSEYLHF